MVQKGQSEGAVEEGEELSEEDMLDGKRWEGGFC